MVAFDTTILILLLDETVCPPWDRDTNQPVTFYKERIQGIVELLEKQKVQILIPAPALSEVLVHAKSARMAYLKQLTSTAAFRVVPFEERAAIEAAEMTSNAIAQGDKKGGSFACWLKVKHDRQIVAIAKAENVSAIYSDDRDVMKIARSVGLQVIGLATLPIPDNAAQIPLGLSTPADSAATPKEQDTTVIPTAIVPKAPSGNA